MRLNETSTLREIPPDDRLKVLAKILALEAESLPEVKAFRKEALGDTLLRLEDVGTWLRKRANWDKLRILAESLNRRYGWHQSHAVAFVLTGLIPLLPKAIITTQMNHAYPALTRIVLEVDPRLSGEVVANIYREARGEVRKGRDKPMHEKHLHLALWLVEHKDQTFTWPGLQGSWNQKYPQWMYTDAGARNFSRDAKKAYERVTGRPWPAKTSLGG